MKSAKDLVAEANTRVKTVRATLPYHNPAFSSGKKLILYCASGGHSALAADTAQSMGLSRVSHLGGGFKSWKEAKGPVETFQVVSRT
jgi:rhodanese-related sulfurtransferase